MIHVLVNVPTYLASLNTAETTVVALKVFCQCIQINTNTYSTSVYPAYMNVSVNC